MYCNFDEDLIFNSIECETHCFVCPYRNKTMYRDLYCMEEQINLLLNDLSILVLFDDE